MTNVKESLLQIKQAENTHNTLINNAKEKAKTLLQEADKLAIHSYDEMINAGKEEANSIRGEAMKIGKQEANTILQQGETEARAIRHIEEDKIEKTIKSIIRRIVENNGNR